MTDPITWLLRGALRLLSGLSRPATLPQQATAESLALQLGKPWSAKPLIERALQEAARAERRACVGHVEAWAREADANGDPALGLNLRALAWELKVGQRNGGSHG